MDELKEYTYVGKRAPRIDALAKVTGEAQYWGDVKLPGMLIGKILTSPYAHARIVDIDTSKAERLPGVRAVVTGKDMPKTSVDWLQSAFLGHLALHALTIDKVRCVGEEVAAVAADNEGIAEEALKLIDVKYEVLDAIYDPEEAMKHGAPKLYGDIENNILIRLSQEYGNVDNGFKEADYTFEDEFKTQPQYHSVLERDGCTCKWDIEGNLIMWIPTQVPHLLRRMYSSIFELPVTKVRIICPYIGGGFGLRSAAFPAGVICVSLAKITGKPVNIDFSRGEDFAHGFSSPALKVKIKTGIKKDGKLTARQLSGIVDCGAHPYHGVYQLNHGVVSAFAHLYKCQNLKYDQYGVYTNNPISAIGFRSFGNAPVTWVVESQMDMIAERLGIDPLELREKNLFESGETSVLGWEFGAYGLPACIKKATEAVNWDQKRREKIPNRGIGMACAYHVSGDKQSYGPISTSSVNLVGNEDGSFYLYMDQSEIGAGIGTAAQQVAAEILGASLENIKVVWGDTEVTPFDLGSYGSRCGFTTGNAVKIAATDMRQQLFEVAASMLEVSVANLDAKDGQIYIKKTSDKKVSIAEVALRIHFVLGTTLVSNGVYNMPCSLQDPSNGVWPAPGMCTSYPAACQIVEVEVDPKTGKVTILNLTVAQDVGFPLNLNTVEGQIEGGVVMGFGYGLTEDLKHEEGRVLVTDFADYLVWRAPDSPEIKPIVVTTDDQYGPFGAKGVGEIVMIPTAPAVANAICNAIGVRIKDIPVTPEKILKALKEKR